MKSRLSIIRMEVSILFPDRVSEKSLEKSCFLCIRRIRVQRHVHSFEAGRARRSVYRALQTVHLPRKTTNATSDRGELRYGFYRSSVPRRKRRASFTSASAVNFRADKSISSQWGVQTDELDFRSTQVFPFRIIGGRFVLDFDEANLWPTKYCVWTGRFKAIPFKSRDFFK